MKKGFTLIELLIALTMSGMIFIAVSSLLVTLLNSNTKSRRQEVFEQAKNDIFVELTNSVRWGEVVNYDGVELAVDEIVYKLDGSSILKNGEAFTSSGVEITRFEVTDRSGVDGLTSFFIEIGMRDRNFNINQDTLTLVVSQRRTEGVEL